MARSQFPLSHSGHDYDELVNRWKKLSEAINADLQPIALIDGDPVLALETNSGSNLPIYISAGVHGDECAPVWALLHWAEENSDLLESESFLIFPCLNPHGLVENKRLDGHGVDLNRAFQDTNIPVISAWHQVVGKQKYRRSLNLHEDYDARGIYLYEIADKTGLGRQILDHCEAVIPCNPDPEVDGQVFDNGLMQHEGDGVRQVVEQQLGGGYPEAIHLFLYHTEIAITFETPSEMDLAQRISAHQRAISAFVSIT